MELHPELAAAIDAGVHGHLVTIGRDGRPQVSVIWLGRDGDELLVAHLGAGQKIRNIEHDDRVAISIEVPGTTPTGLQPWAVFHGTGPTRQTAAGRSCCRRWRPASSVPACGSRRWTTRRRDTSSTSPSTG